MAASLKPNPTEHEEAVELIKWWRLACRRYGLEPETLLHVSNEGMRSWKAGQKLKAEGMRTGAPDYLLLTPRDGFGCLGIELKRQKHGVVQPSQMVMQAKLRRAGNRMEICRGAHEAVAVITEYLSGVKPEQSEIEK